MMLHLFANLCVFLLIVMIHEVAHGFTALKMGDTTARDAGRLTFNPLAHLDPVGTVILPVLLVVMRSPVVFGWARPVPVNPGNFRHPRKGMLLTSLAGPLSNFLTAGVLASVFRITQPGSGSVAGIFLVSGVMISIVLGLFNILPLPPLDGGGIVSAMLPESIRRYYSRLGRYGFLIILLLLYAGLLDRVLLPVTVHLSSFLIGT